MVKYLGEMVATKKDYFEAILAVAQSGVDFGGLDVAEFVQGELKRLEKAKGRVPKKVSEKRDNTDAIVYEALKGFDSAKRVKAIADVAQRSPQAVTASLKRLVKEGKVNASEFEGVSLYAIA